MTSVFANVKQSRPGFLSTDSEQEDEGNAATTWLCKYRQTKSNVSYTDTGRDFKALVLTTCIIRQALRIKEKFLLSLPPQISSLRRLNTFPEKVYKNTRNEERLGLNGKMSRKTHRGGFS